MRIFYEHLPGETPMKNRTLSGLISVGLLLAGLLFVGCRKDVPTNPADDQSLESPFFEDVTAQRGLNFVHDAGPRNYFMPQIVGSGVALFDYDQDGRLDIYLLHNAGPKSSSTN